MLAITPKETNDKKYFRSTVECVPLETNDAIKTMVATTIDSGGKSRITSMIIKVCR